GVLPPQIGCGDLDARLAQPARERRAVHEELDFEARQEDLVEDLDDELVLADGDTPHRRPDADGRSANTATIARNTGLYTSAAAMAGAADPATRRSPDPDAIIRPGGGGPHARAAGAGSGSCGGWGAESAAERGAHRRGGVR